VGQDRPGPAGALSFAGSLLLSWLYLSARLLLYAAEINVVLA
jgi:uncharacterized BrkB/YihY/UPF0761 family membrane protein